MTATTQTQNGGPQMRAVCYARVSTPGQGEGLSLATQQEAVLGACAARGWEVAKMVSDMGSGKRLNPNLRVALGQLDEGRYDALVVARLDRLSRSLADFASLMDRAMRHDWSILLLDPAVDMTTPFGRAMAGVASTFAQLERELISQRQSESIAARKAAGTYVYAGKVGSRRQVSDAALARIRQLRDTGHKAPTIAKTLVLEGLGEWSVRTVYTYMEDQ
jgi:DNA invertase Pin-like site-specific DNA recombinase